MSSRSRKRIDAKGRNPDKFGRENAVLIVRRSLWQSPLVSALSPSARALMIDLLSMYNGSNNGRLFLSVQDATDRLGFSDWRAAGTAFAELEATGLITMTVEGYFDIKAGTHSRARAWRLNWIGDNGERLAIDALPNPDDCDLDARARKRLARRQSVLKRYFKQHQEGKFAAVDSTTLDARTAEIDEKPTVDSTTLNVRNGGKRPNAQMGDSTVHLSYQGGLGSWWSADRFLEAQAKLVIAVAAMARPARFAAAA